ncbi:MAG: hypothetical protein HY865_26905 [Chloroflexi bacterium]|nr:hypothetical protein [Chloroflexota bacterium]
MTHTSQRITEEGHTGKNYDITGAEALDYWQVAKILSQTLGRKIKYRNPNPLYFLFETVRRGTPFMLALVMLGLYTSTWLGMAKSITNQVEKITGKKPISFKQDAEDYIDFWR